MATKLITAEALQALANLIANDLNNKEDVNHTHDMLDIDGLTEAIGNINSFDVIVVDSLPDTTLALSHTIYMIPKKESQTNNVYDEYMLLNGSFEKIGDTEIDLTQYATKTELGYKADLEYVQNNYLTNGNTSTSDCNDWITSGYTRTYSTTANLPSDCTGDDKYGVLFCILENPTYGTGTQIYYPVSGANQGKMYIRSITDGLTDYAVFSDWKCLAESEHNHTLSNITDLDMTAYPKAVDVMNALNEKADKTELINKVNSTSVSNIVVITQSEYDALGTKDTNTLYIING